MNNKYLLYYSHVHIDMLKIHELLIVVKIMYVYPEKGKLACLSHFQVILNGILLIST